MRRGIIVAGLLTLGACQGGGSAVAGETAVAAKVVVTVHTATGEHRFNVDLAETEAKQRQGLMYRTSLAADGGMLFAPYPPEGGAPREASFWMKNVPIPIDIIFIRADGTIARIAENAVPLVEDHIRSGEPIAAVLEIAAGRSAELGISPGDKVSWPGQRK
ncbi:DUF192 domain-containing protein [Sphingomonas sp. M1-B02]|uniref:DUF192 domain-containing protein n=1 Tax=Sphingomonas sp. M1-B02 TaxID=3114300 RepID=UPI0022405846|nr:DUF192 domain-containing protein [Sphingomonas sp. S6-11]UZK67408.1 DUF192 domain-containing protein [Sphingomonas sp. S6-11]